MKHFLFLASAIFFFIISGRSQCSTAELNAVAFNNGGTLAQNVIFGFTVDCEGDLIGVSGALEYAAPQDLGGSFYYQYSISYTADELAVPQSLSVFILDDGVPAILTLDLGILEPFKLTTQDLTIIPGLTCEDEYSVCPNSSFVFGIDGIQYTSCASLSEGNYSLTFPGFSVNGVSYYNSSTTLNIGSDIEINYTVVNGELILTASGGTAPYEYEADLVPSSTGVYIPADWNEGCQELTVTDANGCSASLTTDVSTCPGDLDGNLQVGAADLSMFLAQFGLPNQPSDFDCNGTTSAADLVAFLSLWGSQCN